MFHIRIFSTWRGSHITLGLTLPLYTYCVCMCACVRAYESYLWMSLQRPHGGPWCHVCITSTMRTADKNYSCHLYTPKSTLLYSCDFTTSTYTTYQLDLTMWHVYLIDLFRILLLRGTIVKVNKGRCYATSLDLGTWGPNRELLCQCV